MKMYFFIYLFFTVLDRVLQKNRTFSGERQRKRGREREIDFKELAHVTVGPACGKSMGQASRLESQVRAEVTVLSPNSTSREAGNAGRVSVLQL